MQSPLEMAINMMRNGQNPSAMLGQMASQNPQIRQYMQITQGKNPHQLKSIAENMAKERGISLRDLALNLGIPLQ